MICYCIFVLMLRRTPIPTLTDTIFPYTTLFRSFTRETATQAIRLVLSGVLERFPDVKIILGHLGEGLPFLLWRIDHALSRPGNKPLAFRDVFTRNFYIDRKSTRLNSSH